MDINDIKTALKLIFADPVEGWYSPQYNQDWLNSLRAYTENNKEPLRWTHHYVNKDDPSKVRSINRPKYNDWRKVKIQQIAIKGYDPVMREYIVPPRYIRSDDPKYKSIAKMFVDKYIIKPTVNAGKKSLPFAIPFTAIQEMLKLQGLYPYSQEEIEEFKNKGYDIF